MALIELDQSLDTLTTTFSRGNFVLRYGYARSKDAFVSNLRGEDYLVVRVEANQLAFALCDGVSSSYFGGLAAQIVGERIINWLWDRNTRSYLFSVSSTDDAVSALVNELNAQLPIADRLIRKQNKISKLSNQILRSTYQGILDKSGSQSNFVCGYVERGYQANNKDCVWLFWLGDARLRIWKNSEEKTGELNAKWFSEQSWSTKFGVAGKTFAFRSRTTEINRIFAYTDGLSPYEEKLSSKITDSQLDQILGEEASDDISFLEINIGDNVLSSVDDLVPELRNRPLHQEPQFSDNSQGEGSDVPAPKPTHKTSRLRSAILFTLVAVSFCLIGMLLGIIADQSIPILLFPPAIPTVPVAIPSPSPEMVPSPTPPPRTTVPDLFPSPEMAPLLTPAPKTAFPPR
jgi:Protein phosphatase 2C